MTLVAAYETLTIGDETYQVREHEPSLEAISNANLVGRTVIAQAIDKDGEPLRIPEPSPIVNTMTADEWMAYVHAKRGGEQKTRPIAPYIGTLQTLGSTAYFAVNQGERMPTAIVPCAPSSHPFRLYEVLADE